MPRIIGARFRPAGKIYYFDPGALEIHEGDRVIVPTPQGPDMVEVALGPREVIDTPNRQKLQEVIRVATEEDLKSMAHWEALRPAVLEHVYRRAQALRIPMKPTDAEFTFDGRRVTIGYVANSQLDLADVGREVEQVWGPKATFQLMGARDAARQTGELGVCGRTLCCISFLTDFPPVGIKMAKNQDLPLNPTKISGVCGRLLCCLAYENDFYSDVRSRAPKPGSRIETPQGPGVARDSNFLRETVNVQLESGEVVELALADIRR